MARLPKSTVVRNQNDIPAAAGSPARDVVMARDSGTGMIEPAMGSIRDRIAQFERQPRESTVQDDDEIDRTTTVDSEEIGQATTVDTEIDNQLFGEGGEIERAPTLDSTEFAREDSSVTSESPKRNESTAQDLDDIQLSRLESLSVSADVSIATGKSGATIGGNKFEKMRAPTPNAFDVAMDPTQNSDPQMAQNDGGRMWETAAAVPPQVPRVAREEGWVVETSQNASILESCDLTVSTAGGAFDTAHARAMNYQPPKNVEDQDGGRIWEIALEKSKIPPLPVLARAMSSGSVVNSSKFENMRAATPESHSYPLPQEDGGRMWDMAADESKKINIPAVLKTPLGSEQHPTSEEQSQASEDMTHHTSGAPTFEKMRAPTPDHHKPPGHPQEGGPQEGGRLWESAVKISKAKPVPTLAQRQDWIIEAIQLPSIAGDSCDLTESTYGGANAFDMVAARSTDPQPAISIDQSEGGPMWEKAATTYQKPTPPAVAKPRFIVDVEIERRKRSNTADASLSTNGGEIFEHIKSHASVSQKPSQAIEGGRLWELAVEKSKIPSVPALAQKEEWTIDAIHRPSMADSYHLTVSTLGGTSAFDSALSPPRDNQQARSPSREKGGPLWEKASTTYQKPPLPALAKSPPRSSTPDRRSLHRAQSQSSVDGTVSTAGGASFEKLITQRPDQSKQTNAEIDGGRLWELAVETGKPKPVPALARQKEWIAEATQTPSVAEISCDLTESTGYNAFDEAVSRSGDNQGETSPDSATGGRLWEKAAATYRKPPLAAVAKSPPRVAAVDKQSPRTAQSQSFVDEPVSSVGGPPSEKPRTQGSDRDNRLSAEFDGGKLWELAVETSKPKPVPALAQERDWTAEALRTPSVAEVSYDLTESTCYNAFDEAVSRSDNNQGATSPNNANGGPLWEKAATTYQKSRPPAVVKSPPRKESPCDAQSHVSDDATLSTIGGSIFDKMRSQANDADQKASGDIDGGRLWESALKASGRRSGPNVSKPRFHAPLKGRPHDQDDVSDCPTMSTIGGSTFEKIRRPTPDSSRNRQGEMQGGLVWQNAASSQPLCPPLVQGIKVLSSRHYRHQCLDEQSQKSDPTVGGPTFEKMRAPTPDAFDRSIAKSQTNEETEVFEDEEIDPTPTKPSTSSSGGSFARALKEQTQSRAEPHAKPKDTPQKMVNPMREVEMEDDLYPVKNNKAKSKLQRRQMTHLLGVSCFVTLFGFLGNFYVSESCYFASAQFAAGPYSAAFDMRFGLWKYSPVESALIGFPYCMSYDDGNYAGDTPVAARAFHLLSLFTGTASLGVLWYYLVFGSVTKGIWSAAIASSALAAVFQLLTFLFFASGACDGNGCEWGLGSSIALVTAFSWILLAIELQYQTRYVLGNEVKSKKDTKKIEMSSITAKKKGSGPGGAYSPPNYT